MAVLSFPANPVLNQTYTFGGKSWRWNGSVWVVVRTTAEGGESAYQIAVRNGFVGTEAEWLASLEGGGSELYTWVAYADDLAGTTNFSLTFDGHDFMGLGVNKNSPTPSTNPADYSWVSIGGNSSIQAFLTNESHIVAASAAGDVASFDGAGGTFMVYEGTADVTNSATFSVVSEIGLDVSINSAGVYIINSMSADSGTATFRAVYSGVTIDRKYSISKARAGATGGAAVLGIAASAQAFTYTDGIATPASQTITLTAGGVDGSITWTAIPSNLSFSVSGTNGEIATLTVGNFGTRTQVVLIATHDETGMTDRITLFRLNQSSAEGGATQNQQFSSPYDPGVVTKPTPGTGTSAGFDSDAYSAPSIVGDFTLKFVPLENGNGGIIVALDDTPNATNPGASNSDFSFVLGTSSLDAYATGTKVNSDAYVEGDILEIRRVSATWSWWKNGVQLFSQGGSTANVGVRITLQSVGAVVDGIQLLQNGVSKSLVLTSRGSVTATSLPAENARNEYQGSVRVLINGVWNTYATRTVHTGPWQSGHTYAVGDIFTFAGVTYMVTTPHLSTGSEPDLSKVEILSSQGPAGDGGLSGFLTNESHLVSADSSGFVSSFAGAGGTFRVFLGGNDVTSNCSFGVISETGVDVSINATTGAYTVSSMSADTGTAVFSAQLDDGPILQKTYSIAKSRPGADGTNAKLIYVTSDRQTITYDSAGSLNPSSQTITFNAIIQNSGATANWTMKTMSGTLLDASLYLSQTTGASVSMSAAQFNSARGTTEGIIVTATINDSGTYSDSISVVRVKQGASGTPGQDGFTGVLTNESHTVATAPDGTGGNFTNAGGTFKVFKGLVDFTTGQGVVYSLQSATGVAVNINSSTGVYTITGMTADQGVAVFRANYAGTIVDKTYTIVKARAGVDGQTAKLIYLTSNRQTIAYDNTDTILPSQDIILTVSKQNTTATINWTLQTIQGSPLTAATYLSATSGDTVTMTATHFDAAISGTQGVIITATANDGGSTFTDSISVIKVRDGVDGTAALTGYLTNEAHVLAAESDGTVTDFTNSGGSFKLFHGTTDVSNAASYDVFSETGVDVSINTTTGVYTVDGMVGDVGSATFEATWSGVTIRKVYTIVKSRAGVDGSSPKLLSVTSNAQTVVYDSAGTATPPTQSLTFTAVKQNTSASVTWVVKDLNGATRTPLATYLTVAGNTATMSESQFAAARNSTGGVVVSATLTDGITLTDSVSVVRVASGATGAAGADGIVGLLTNEAHTVAADTAGNVSSFSSAGGIFKIFEGSTDLTGSVTVTYSVQASAGVSISIASTGIYTVTGMSAGTGTATLRAVYKGINIDKLYTISKAFAGADGTSPKILTISSDRQTITYGGDGAVNPSAQTTTFSAQKQNTTGTVNWTIKRSDGTVLTPATYLSATTGDTVTMTASNFDAARGTSAGVMVTGTITDGVTISDTISVMKVQSGADGTGSKIGYLTNEAHIVPTAGDGSSPDFSGATGTFKVFNGLTDVTTAATFDIPTGGAVNCTGSIDATTGVYSVTAMSSNAATLEVRAQHGPTTLTKIFSLVKSRAGADGAPAKLVSVSSTHQTFSYTSVGGIRTQTTTITAQRQNTTQPTNWKVYTLDGTLRLGSGAAAITNYFTDGGDTLTLTHTNFNNFITAYGGQGMIVEGSFLDGQTFSDRISIIKISDGSAGTAGADAKLFAVYSNRQTISYTGAGAISPATQDIVFNAVKQNTTGAVTWTLSDADGTARTPVTTYLSAATGDTVTMTAAQFESARASTPGVIVTGTLTDGQVFTDKISVTQVKAGTNAVTAFLSNEAATVPSDTNGNVSGADLATVAGTFKVYQGTADVSTGQGITYSVQAQSGITATINSTTGAYTVSALSANVGVATFAATLPAGLGGGVLFKDLTVSKAASGTPAVNAHLTTTSVTLAANNSGTVSDFSPANGIFVVTSGLTVLATPNVSFSVLSATGATASINATTGAYSISAMSADQGTIVFRALTGAAYGSVTIDKTMTLSKAKQGPQGPAITLTPSATAFTVVDGALTPASQSITITATLGGVAGPVTWSTSPNIASGTGTSFTITSTQFNPSVNSQVVVVASVPTGEQQAVVLIRTSSFSPAWLSAASTAQTQASAAASLAADIADDNKFSSTEKRTYFNQIVNWAQTVPQMVTQANNFGLTTEATNLNNAWTTFYNYLVANHYQLLGQSDTINRTTFQNNEKAFQNALTALSNALTTKASQTATWNNLGSVPAELTDGRLATGLNPDGTLAINIPSSILTGSNVLRRNGGGLFTGHLASTRGATLGVDTFDVDGVTALTAAALKNASITVDGSGNLIGIGTSGVNVDNSKQLWNQVTGTGKPADGATVNNVTYSATQPGTATNGDIWVDTSSAPNKVRVRVSGAWQLAANNATDTLHLSDGAGLGTRATWSNVTGSGRPADNATSNNVTYSSTPPTGPGNGDIWIDTSVTPNVTKVRVGGTWQIGATYVTDTAHLLDGAGLGTRAAWVNITGSGKPADGATANNISYGNSPPPVAGNGDIWIDTSINPNVQKVRVAGSWVIAANLTTGTSQLSDDAGLGTTASWGSVQGRPTSLADLDAAAAQAIGLATGDGVLTKSEKRGDLKNTLATLESEYTQASSRGTALSLPTSPLDTARTNFYNLLNTYSPAYNDYTQDTTIYTHYFDDASFPAGWSVTNAGTSASGAYTILNDNTGTAIGAASRSKSAAASTQFTAAVVVKKDTAPKSTRFAMLRLATTGGTVKTADLSFDTSTGESASTGTNVWDATGVLDLGTDWLVWGTLTTANNSTGITVQVYPAVGAGSLASGSYNNATQGSIYIMPPLIVQGDSNKLGHFMLTAKLKAYTDAIETLWQAISGQDASTANWVNISGAGKPADGATVNNVQYAASAPASPSNGDIWVDTSVTPNVTRVRVGGAWQAAGNYTTTMDHLNDGSTYVRYPATDRTKLGGVASGATANNVTYSASAPASPGNGDIWVNTGVTPNITNVRVAGAWQAAGNYTTTMDHLADGGTYGRVLLSRVSGGKPVVDFAEGIHFNKNMDNLADGATYVRYHTNDRSKLSGVAAGATANNVTYSGVAPGSPVNGDIWVNNGVTPAITYVRVAGAWQAAGNYTTDVGHLSDAGGLTYRADWNRGDFINRPTHLTDSRIATALNSSGQLVSGIPASTRIASGIMGHSSGGTYSGDLNATYGSTMGVNVFNAYIDYLADTGTYAKIRTSQLNNGFHNLTVAGSGMRVADQRNLPAMTVMNLNYKWNGSISFSASSTTSATISVGASSVLIGSVSVNYNAMSVGVTGTAGAVRLYYIYLDDAGYAGGTKTLVASQVSTDIYASDDRVYVGTIQVTFPSAAGGSTGGGGDTGGGGCVASYSWIETQDGWKQASEVVPGDMVLVLNEEMNGVRWEPVTHNVLYQEEFLFRLRSESGFELVCSSCTPITLRDGTAIAAWQVRGQELPVLVDDKFSWEPVWAEPAGLGPVQRISCNSNVYAAGTELGKSILTHNLQQYPKP
jgi:hypothetical protein